MSVLAQIAAEKQRQIAAARAAAPESVVRARAAARREFRDFKTALRRPSGVAVIAEVKRASPSAGVIRADFEPVGIARQYEEGGAAAISVLTEEKFFQGHLDFLPRIRSRVRLPLLRKDFILDEYQVYESVAAGADAILLIVALLDFERLRRLHDVARRAGLAVLVEIHDEEEVRIALRAGAEIVGINNRNLKDFSVSLETTERLAAAVKGRAVLVSESGIHTRADVERVRRAGADAILVGESLMRCGDIAAKVRELVGG